ncbi:MAG: putative ABC exporter domain-containing protein, partial [Arenimonas sp.]
MSNAATVLRAFAYLRAISLYNGVRQRLLRLRQPKYLAGAIAGLAYFYFFVIRHFLDQSMIRPGAAEAMPGQVMPLFALFAGAGVLIVVIIAWLLPGDRAALQFSEAEVAFLFPAPLSRVALIQFSLLRSQLALFVSSFLMSLVLGKGGALGGNPLHHALAIWLALATVKLHFVGASFGRERLLDLGVRPLLRRAIVLAVLVVLGALCWWWMERNLSLPKKSDLADFADATRYAGTILATRPLSWLLVPFNALVAPLFATDAEAFYKALVPAALLLLAHYLWVVRSHVSFEEASIDHARRRAEKQQARRDGKSGPRNSPAKPRVAPFRLAPEGFAPIAFLWKGLIAAGPFWRLRNWLLASALVLALCLWLGAGESTKPLLKVVGLLAGVAAIWLLIAGPMFMQRGLRRTFEYLDVL